MVIGTNASEGSGLLSGISWATYEAQSPTQET